MASHHQQVAAPKTPRAVRFDPDARTFYPYRVVENGRTLPLIVDCSTLEEAVERGKVHCFHKEHLLVSEVSRHGRRFHLYAIRRKATPRYVHRDHVTSAVHDLYAAKVCEMDAAMLSGVGE